MSLAAWVYLFQFTNLGVWIGNGMQCCEEQVAVNGAARSYSKLGCWLRILCKRTKVRMEFLQVYLHNFSCLCFCCFTSVENKYSSKFFSFEKKSKCIHCPTAEVQQKWTKWKIKDNMIRCFNHMFLTRRLHINIVVKHSSYCFSMAESK